jgi:hypothetical protein
MTACRSRNTILLSPLQSSCKATASYVSDESAVSTCLAGGMTGMCQCRDSHQSLPCALSAYLAVLDEQHSASEDAEGPVAAA